MLILIPLFIATTVISLLRDDKELDDELGIVKCSFIDWFLLALQFIVCLSFSFLAIKLLSRQYEEKQRCGYGFHSSDFDFSRKGAMKLSGIAFVVGTFGSSLGIGGGMIIVPVLLELGMLSVVSSGTGMYLVIFTSLSTVVQFMIKKQFRWFYALFLGLCSLIGTYFGISIVNGFVKRQER